MTKSPHDNDRDQVLYEFHIKCPHPTAAQIIEWTDRYPQFAEDIRIHAAISRDWDAGDDEDLPIDDTMMARAHSRVLNALFGSETRGQNVEGETAVGFHDMLRANNKEIYQIARELDVGRDVLADLFNGWMNPPVGQRLVDAVCSLLGITSAAFQRAVELAVANPKVGHAKSATAPSVPRRSYEEIVRSSNMKDERIRFWLGET